MFILEMKTSKINDTKFFLKKLEKRRAMTKIEKKNAEENRIKGIEKQINNRGNQQSQNFILRKDEKN